LWGTNLLRFGDGFEFGHRLNLQEGSLLGSIYATRFDYPFQAEPLWRAGRELLGALFASPKWNGSAWYATEIFAGQSPMVRWREFYFTTYDWSYTAQSVSFQSRLDPQSQRETHVGGGSPKPDQRRAMDPQFPEL
jgi:hypothetical protein